MSEWIKIKLETRYFKTKNVPPSYVLPLVYSKVFCRGTKLAFFPVDALGCSYIRLYFPLNLFTFSFSAQII